MDTTSHIHFLMNSVTVSVNLCMLFSEATREHLEACFPIGQTKVEITFAQVLHVWVSAYRKVGTKWSRALICRKEGRGGPCRNLEKLNSTG